LIWDDTPTVAVLAVALVELDVAIVATSAVVTDGENAAPAPLSAVSSESMFAESDIVELNDRQCFSAVHERSACATCLLARVLQDKGA
jgi:hypothetical protein